MMKNVKSIEEFIKDNPRYTGKVKEDQGLYKGLQVCFNNGKMHNERGPALIYDDLYFKRTVKVYCLQGRFVNLEVTGPEIDKVLFVNEIAIGWKDYPLIEKNP